MITRVKQLFSLLGADEAVLCALLWRATVAACGLITLNAIARHLTKTEQGFYFTFNSIVGVRVFLDLSFSYVISIMASHEAIGLRWRGYALLKSDSRRVARLGTLLRVVGIWYAAGASIFLVFALTLGPRFLRLAAADTAWGGPWVAVAITSAILFAFTPYYSVLEGCGRVASVARLRTTELALGSVCLWIALQSGWGLYAAAVQPLVQAIFQATVFCTRWRHFFQGLYAAGEVKHIKGMLAEMWPFQWRIALSAMGGYFIVSALVPIAFAKLGAIQAGQVGMSLAIINAVASLAGTWVNTKAPLFGNLVAQRDFASLDRIFQRCFSRGAAVMVSAAISLALAVMGLALRHHPFSERIVDPTAFALFASLAVINFAIGAEAVYLRAHKKEPFLALSLLSGLTQFAVSWGVVGSFGVRGLALGYTFTGLGFGIYATVLFFRKRREWHRPEPPRLPTEKEPGALEAAAALLLTGR